MTELFSICRCANRRRIACQADTLTVRPGASHGIIVFKTACNRYGGDMIAHLVIRAGFVQILENLENTGI